MATVNQKIISAIERLQLDLRGKTVLTEGATGAYTVTPVIAALAGAEVFAFTKDTPYGSVEDVRAQTMQLLDDPEAGKKVHIITELTPDIISKADIITNSGHLRPLDKSKLQHAKNGAALPLMYEAWEWREADVELSIVKSKGLLLGATNERHPDVDVFSYLGDMALKQIFDAGLNPYKNRFILICNNDFGPHIASVVSKICDGLAVCDLSGHKERYREMNVDWIGNFPDYNIPSKYKDSEAIIFTAYPFTDTWIGDKKEVFSVEKLTRELSHPRILRFAGHLDEEACKNKIEVFPARVKPGHMGILPSAIGFDPIIRLQSGGLKVGELLLCGETKHNGIRLVEPIDR